MLQRLMRAGLVILVVAILGVASFAQVARTAPVEGVWQLKTYSGGGNEGTASGQLILENGHFSYVYTMNEQRTPPDGRAHAGRYRLDPDGIVFLLNWDLHYVGGKGTVTKGSAESKTRTVVNGNTMTVTFSNGAAQTFERVLPAQP